MHNSDSQSANNPASNLANNSGQNTLAVMLEALPRGADLLEGNRIGLEKESLRVQDEAL